MRRGESIAVNGVCLTSLPNERVVFVADLSNETLSVTSLGSLAAGTRVNLERALSLGAHLGGHIVQGHVDAVGRLDDVKREGDFAVFRWSFPRQFGDFIISKGSIAVTCAVRSAYRHVRRPSPEPISRTSAPSSSASSNSASVS